MCAELPDKARDNPPSGWEGATNIWMPEGLAMLLSGQIRADSGGLGSTARFSPLSEISKSDFDNAGSGAATSLEGAAASLEESDESDGSDLGSRSDDGGCSVAPAGRGTALLPLVLLTAAAFLARRRRRG
jgi:MYXO-CTERM domain-containing protein